MGDAEFVQLYAEAPRHIQKAGGRVFARVKKITRKHFDKHPTAGWFASIDGWISLAAYFSGVP
jgi:hypothetical protein